MIEAYKAYKSAGLATLPTKKDKSPDCGTWNNGITDENLYLKSFGIGIICGKVSGGLECIDFDNHFGDAKQVLTDFISIPEVKLIYEIHRLPIESTMNGGYHLLFRCEYNEGNQKLAQRPKLDKNNKWRPDTLIETRGINGYFVAAPTEGYKVVKNDLTLIEVITKEERNILLSNCKLFNKWAEPKKIEFENTDRPGDLYNRSVESKSEMENELSNAGWTERKPGEWIRPGKKEGISATIGKVADNIFYVFSSNTYPFEPNTAYTPFQVLTILKYNSDFKECAKALSEKYGTKKEYAKPKEKTEQEIQSILEKIMIDTSANIEKPPVIAYIADISGMNTVRKRLFTLSNFSAIIGKVKSRKTTLLSMITAAMLKDDGIYNKFYHNLPHEKRLVLYFDTEQGDYDAFNNAKRIETLAGENKDYFGAFCLREYSPIQRCEIIEHALKKMPQIGFVVIDGIADLANAVNDELEATRVIGLLLRWTKQYNIHITTVLHQNKNDNFATGWLGSAIMKKAEIVISTTKEKGSDKETKVSCDFSRGIDFEDFDFFINDKYIPELTTRIMTNAVDSWHD
jgi:hypothetical protein